MVTVVCEIALEEGIVDLFLLFSVVVIFDGRASFSSFVSCIIGEVFYLEAHEMLGYFPNHREENVCTSIRVFSQEASRKQGIG